MSKDCEKCNWRSSETCRSCKAEIQERKQQQREDEQSDHIEFWGFPRVQKVSMD